MTPTLFTSFEKIHNPNMMNRRISFLFGVLVLMHVSPPQTVDAKNSKKEAAFPKFVPEGDDVFNDDNPFVEDTQTIPKMKDTKKDTKKGKDNKKQSKKSSDCSFEPSGDIRATPDEVVTGPAASEGEGDFHFEFSSGFRAMDYDITIFDQSSISGADLYCASEGNEADTPVVSLGFRDREQTFYSQVKNGDIEETTCAEDGSVINNVVSLYDAMRRGMVYLEIEVNGDTPSFLRGQLVTNQSVCF